MRLMTVTVVVLLLSGCISLETRRYSIETVKVSPAFNEPDLDDLRARLRAGAPDETVQVSEHVKHLIYYSGKTLIVGSKGFTRESEKERFIQVVQDGKISDQYRNIQVIDGTNSGCNFITDKGGCGTESGRSCGAWGKTGSYYDSPCPTAIDPRYKQLHQSTPTAR